MQTLYYRSPCLALALLLLIQSFYCVPISAQSGSPLQPEFTQPTTVGSDDIVNLSSGDLTYSVPLFEIGGFPVNLTYSSDHKMEEEASWVGFGWNLSPGAISRQVRGIPDDFKGKEITHLGSMAPNVTTGISPGTDVEIFGAFGLAAGTNFTYNNYVGFDISRDLSPSINIAAALSQSSYEKPTTSSDDSERKTDGAPEKKIKYNLNLSSNWNSTAGMSSINFYGSKSKYVNGGTSIDFGGFTYTPVGKFPRRIKAFTWHGKIGGTFWPVSMHATLRGQRTESEYKVNIVDDPSFGYLYLQDGESLDKAVLDYNSSSGGIFVENSPNLPVAFGTPDAFIASGIGFSGQIAVARNDVGIFHPPANSGKTVPVSVGGDLSFGNLIHAGANVGIADVTVTGGPWKQRNGLEGSLAFAPNHLLRENAYMRIVGEPTTCLDMNWYASVGEEDPITTTLRRGPDLGPAASSSFTRYTGYDRTASTTSVIGLPIRGQEDRRKRITSVSYLTAAEANFAAVRRQQPIHRPILSDNVNEATNFQTFQPQKYLNRLPDDQAGGLGNPNGYALGRQPHHLSEIRATTSSGQRFVYGLPAYNQIKQEVTFNVANGTNRSTKQTFQNQESANYGTVSYRPGIDDSANNNNGTDKYFDEVQTSPYANSFLITSILSPDYVDRSNDGPSLDDLGQYVNFEYSSNSSNGIPSLGYRTPMQTDRATFNPGNLSDPNDDKGSFIYGTKEVYYPHHIDSKTHRAVFITSHRDDALTVANRRGQLATSNNRRMLQLDEIRIYTLAELMAGADEAQPIKTVHFTYSADHPNVSGISAGIPNHATGGTKLTLASIHFTYADNERGAENPYVFHYNTSVGGSPTGYTAGRLDRWGNQRPVDDNRNPFWYPYSLQTEEAAEYLSLNNLDRIELPTGGEIAIDYEADDYAYVQNKRAGQMYPIYNLTNGNEPVSTGLSSCSGSNMCDVPIYNPGNSFGDARENLIVDIEDVVSPDGGAVSARELARKLYLEDVDQLYFDVEVDLGNNGYCKGSCRERVTGYLPKDYYEVQFVMDGTTVTHLKIILTTIDANFDGNSSGIHPITFAALDKIANQIPNLKYDMSNFNGHLTIGAMLSLARQGGDIFSNFYHVKTQEGAARMLNLNKSYVRLANASRHKIGDGSRVRRIRVTDAWLEDEASFDAATTYTKVYDYTTTDGTTGERISSGVAANEPMIGKSENLLINVVRTPEKNFLAPDATFYTETPAGMPFYPGGQVSYSKVTTTTELDETFDQSKPGFTVSEFYTAKDFPIINRQTDVIKKKDIPLPISLAFVSTFISRVALSQGYSIILNDMHGKMRKVSEHNYQGVLISSSEYIYREGAVRDGVRSLDNLVDVVTSDNNTRSAYLGQEVDLWQEMRQSKSTTYGGGVQAQVDVGFPGGWIPLPLAVPTAYPNINSAFTSFRSAVTTKVVRKYGILDKVVVMNNGAKLTNKSTHWDELTGQATLTQTQNEFDQNIYSHTLPAYHVDEFQSMGPAYINDGLRLGWQLVSDGRITGTSGPHIHSRLLYPGDEFAMLEFGIFGDLAIRRAYVMPNSNNELLLVDEAGDLYNRSSGNTFALQKMVQTRSGRRNLLGHAAQNTTSFIAPDNVNYWSGPIEDVVLSSTAMDYSDRWGNQCLPAPTIITEQEELNCDQISENLNAMVSSLFSLSDCSECEVRGVNFDGATKKKLIECRLCEELFDLYADNGWISNIEQYLPDSVECNLDGTVSLNRLSADGQKNAESCAFINSSNPWLITDGELFTRARNESGIVIDPNPPGCDEHPCNLPAPPGELIVYGSNFETYDSIDYAFIYDCFPWDEADSGNSPGNPYFNGSRGVWRLETNLVAKLGDRLRTGKPDIDHDNGTFDQAAIYRDGAISSYSPYWYEQGRYDEGHSHQFTNRILTYDDAGNGLESVDAIGIRGATQFGFQKELLVATVQNAAMTDIGFESFEDYDYSSGASPDNEWGRQFSFYDATEATLTDQYSHTGLYSMRITRPILTFNYNTRRCNDIAECPDYDACGCLNGFEPSPDKTYIFSLWVANESSLKYGASPGGANGTNYSVQVNYQNGGTTIGSSSSFHVTGSPIEGWQRIYGSISVPEDASEIQVRLTSKTGHAYYVDDVRVHPEESYMTSYAYHPRTMRLMAEMDENGYAIFFEYDDEGMLVRRKRETERGVMTITEQRTNSATQLND